MHLSGSRGWVFSDASGRPLFQAARSVLTSCPACRSFAHTLCPHLLNLLQHLGEVVARRILQRREFDVGRELLQPQLLTDRKHVPIIEICGAGGGEGTAEDITDFCSSPTAFSNGSRLIFWTWAHPKV